LNDAIRGHAWRQRAPGEEGEIVGGELVIACRDPATLLDVVEEPFDPVAGAAPVVHPAACSVALS